MYLGTERNAPVIPNQSFQTGFNLVNAAVVCAIKAWNPHQL